MNKIVERIVREAGIPDLLSVLAEKLSPTDLQSLLLEVYQIRSERFQPPDLLKDFQSNRFVRPSPVPPISLMQGEAGHQRHWKRKTLRRVRDHQSTQSSMICSRKFLH